jgi:CRISPR-associated endonuclease Csy4
MDHYVDVQVLPTPEIGEAHVMNTLAAKLHLMLAEFQSDDIGVSFPGYQLRPPRLGNVLRLHSSRSRLEQLMSRPWMLGLYDYVRIVGVAPIPKTGSHCSVRRIQVRSSAERIRRRQMRRHGWSAEEAQVRIPDTVERRLNLPFLSLRSSSTGQLFHLFIEQRQAGSPAPGRFNAYGLSQAATVPWF